MAQSLRRSRRAAPARSLKDVIRAGPAATLEALVIAGIGVAVGLVFGLYDGTRELAWDALAYGWIPVAAWFAAALTALRYHRRFVRTHWRWWVLAAALTTISVGILSVFHTGDGVFAESSLGGDWGETVGGTPVSLLAGKMAAIAFITPLLLFSRPVGTVYLRVLRYIGLGVQFAPVYVYMGLYRSVYFVEQRLSSLVNPYLREKSLNRVWGVIGRVLPARLRARVVKKVATGPSAQERFESADAVVISWSLKVMLTSALGTYPDPLTVTVVPGLPLVGVIKTS